MRRRPKVEPAARRPERQKADRRQPRGTKALRYALIGAAVASIVEAILKLFRCLE